MQSQKDWNFTVPEWVKKPALWVYLFVSAGMVAGIIHTLSSR